MKEYCEFYPEAKEETCVCSAGSDVSNVTKNDDICSKEYSSNCQWAKELRNEMKNFLVQLSIKGVIKHKILIKSFCLDLSIVDAMYRLSFIDKIDYFDNEEAEFVATEFTVLEEQGFFVFV